LALTSSFAFRKEGRGDRKKGTAASPSCPMASSVASWARSYPPYRKSLYSPGGKGKREKVGSVILFHPIRRRGWVLHSAVPARDGMLKKSCFVRLSFFCDMHSATILPSGGGGGGGEKG